LIYLLSLIAIGHPQRLPNARDQTIADFRGLVGIARQTVAQNPIITMSL